MALIMGTEMKRRITERTENGFFDDVDTRLFTRGYQVAEAVSDEPKTKPVKVTGKCCARCVHRYGDKMDYCVRHNHDEYCYRFKLAKGLFLKK